jgi:hypothetical protein
MITSYYAQECITNQQKQLVEIQQPANGDSGINCAYYNQLISIYYIRSEDHH